MRSQREKLLHAIVFFHENTNYCHEIKLYKLVHFFDFEIYSKTGLSPTGLDYFAYPMGPVPKALRSQFRSPPADLQAAMAVSTDGDRLRLRPRIPFNEKLFSRRESRVMRELAEIYVDTLAEDMSTASHDRRHPHGWPWHQVHEVEKREWALIPYELALARVGAISREHAEEIADDAQIIARLSR